MAPDGYPTSWRHYLLGVQHLARAAARDTLQQHRAMLMTQVKKEQREQWALERTIEAGWKDE